MRNLEDRLAGKIVRLGLVAALAMSGCAKGGSSSPTSPSPNPTPNPTPDPKKARLELVPASSQTGSISGKRGQEISYNIQYTEGATKAAAFRFYHEHPEAVAYLSADKGIILVNAEKDLGVTKMQGYEVFMTHGFNDRTIDSGTLATVKVKLADNANGTISINLTNASASDSLGKDLAVEAKGSTITVSASQNAPEEQKYSNNNGFLEQEGILQNLFIQGAQYIRNKMPSRASYSTAYHSLR